MSVKSTSQDSSAVKNLIASARARASADDLPRLNKIIEAYVVFALFKNTPALQRSVNPWRRERMLRRYHTLETALKEFVATGVLR